MINELLLCIYETALVIAAGLVIVGCVHIIRIICYAHLGQHSEAVFGYYYRMTKPDKLGACKHLLQEYHNLGPIEDRRELIVRQRIGRR